METSLINTSLPKQIILNWNLEQVYTCEPQAIAAYLYKLSQVTLILRKVFEEI